jgi:hypothetical protein
MGGPSTLFGGKWLQRASGGPWLIGGRVFILKNGKEDWMSVKISCGASL